MPPSLKTQKRSGAPKAKGAVRAKSGCYTCRIRRKKCDEQPNVDGYCQTCIRLKLECLGFGAKRPEWLRENRNVVELRDRIKRFLASQGMIKGHSGSAVRVSEQEPTMLRLAGDGSSSSESSPPTPTLTIDDCRPPHHGHNTSSIRDVPWHSGAYHDLPSHVQEFPDDSLFSSSVDEPAPEVMLSPYANPLPPITSSSHSLVSSPSWSHPQSLFLPSYAVESALSPSYNHNNYLDDEYTDDPFPGVHPLPGTHIVYAPANEELVQYYMVNVLELQYLLADHNLSRVMRQSTENSLVTLNAVCLLSHVHQYKARYQGDQSEINHLYRSLRKLFTKNDYSADDAMAALHVISSLLFNGGKGEWLQWLGVAYNFVDSILRLGLPRGLGYFLTHCSEDIRYIFKTAMWFDVLASICLFQSPHFLLVYRQLFQPPDAHINNLPAVIQPELSMMSVMGCENHVVWAMAEVTALLAWKESQQRQGCLSIPALVERGLRIEKHILCRSGPPLPPKNDIHYHRYVTSDVFRASTRVYLHSVLSGDFPNCPEIMESVDDTIRCLKRVSEMGSGVFGNRSSRSVVRSVVFSIFICGCLTDDLEKRKYLLDCLTAQTAETVGNCPEVKDLMEDVWAVPRTPDEPVLWRLQLRESGILLV